MLPTTLQVFIQGRYGPQHAATVRSQGGFEPEKKGIDGRAVRKPSVINKGTFGSPETRYKTTSPGRKLLNLKGE